MDSLTLEKIAKNYVRGVLVTFAGLSSMSLYDCYKMRKNKLSEFKESLRGPIFWSVTWPISHPFIAGCSGKHGKYLFGFWLALILIP